MKIERSRTIEESEEKLWRDGEAGRRGLHRPGRASAALSSEGLRSFDSRNFLTWSAYSIARSTHNKWNARCRGIVSARLFSVRCYGVHFAARETVLSMGWVGAAGGDGEGVV